MPQLPDWARALGPPLFECRIRSKPADFIVTERMDIEFSDDGEHDWLWIEKSGANTHWVAERLASHASIRRRDVGYAGLKDRHAITQQWFSVRRPSKDGIDWTSFAADGVRILSTERHSRKLKRGTHRGNAFRIAVRSPDVTSFRGEIDARLGAITSHGVPNYFGEQRFGRDGANIELGEAIISGRRVPRHKRSIGISALRSYRFNEELDARIRDGSWDTLRPGDVANLDGSNSTFQIEEVTDELELRCQSMDIHPAGSLPEIKNLGVKSSWRPLRMRVRDLSWEIENEELRLDFKLGRGSYATSVLREIVRNSWDWL